jgi:hypothetical protein
MFGGCDFQQTVGIHGLLKTHKKEANFMFHYIDDALSLNHSTFGDFVDRIYPIELEINDTQYTDRYASYIDLNLEIDSEGRKRTKLYDKCDDFNYPIVNFPFIYISTFQQHLHMKYISLS